VGDPPYPEAVGIAAATLICGQGNVGARRADGPERLAAAGITWEALAGWLQGPMGAKAWEAVIPSMG
jgi:hypothetical protein